MREKYAPSDRVSIERDSIIHTRFNKFVAALSAVALTGCSTYLAREDTGAVLITPPGCEEIPAATEDDHDDDNESVVLPDRIDAHYREIQTFKNHLDLSKLDIREIISQVREFEPVERFTTEGSGINVVVYSDGDLVVNQDALEEILHLNIHLNDSYTDPQLQAVMSCYRERIIDHKEFAGVTLNLMVPSRPERCLKDLRFSERTPDDPRGSCQFSGFTPPTLKHDGAMIKLISSEYLMIVAPGSIAGPGLDEDRFAEVMLHEAAHFNDALVTLPIRIKENERAARYITSRAIDHYGRDLPHPITYKR